jgi:NADH:ubiquinone oxidoreductase subunit E
MERDRPEAVAGAAEDAWGGLWPEVPEGLAFVRDAAASCPTLPGNPAIPGLAPSAGRPWPGNNIDSSPSAVLWAVTGSTLVTACILDIHSNSKETRSMKNEEVLQEDRIFAKYGKDANALVHILQDIQATLGYVSLESQRRIADHLGVPASRVYGIVSFYNYFKTQPPGRHQIHVCMGTACYVRGAAKLIDKIKADFKVDPGETTSDRRLSLEEVRCIGCCAIGPVMTVDGDVYGDITPEKISSVLETYE